MGGLQASLNPQYFFLNFSPPAILQSCPDQKPSEPESRRWWSCAKSPLNGLSALDSLQVLTTLVEVLV